MWLFSTAGFVSIVEYKPDPTRLLVRARHADDIPALFGVGVTVEVNPTADYRFRSVISRERVAEVIAAKVADIHYPNFKNTLNDHRRAAAYMNVWAAMERYQSEITG